MESKIKCSSCDRELEDYEVDVISKRSTDIICTKCYWAVGRKVKFFDFLEMEDDGSIYFNEDEWVLQLFQSDCYDENLVATIPLSNALKGSDFFVIGDGLTGGELSLLEDYYNFRASREVEKISNRKEEIDNLPKNGDRVIFKEWLQQGNHTVSFHDKRISYFFFNKEFPRHCLGEFTHEEFNEIVRNNKFTVRLVEEKE